MNRRILRMRIGETPEGSLTLSHALRILWRRKAYWRIVRVLAKTCWIEIEVKLFYRRALLKVIREARARSEHRTQWPLGKEPERLALSGKITAEQYLRRYRA